MLIIENNSKLFCVRKDNQQKIRLTEKDVIPMGIFS